MATWGLELRSPVGAPSRKYTWPLFFGSTRVGKTKDRHDRATEIVETIKWVCEDYQELWEWDVLGQCIQNCDTKSYESMKYLCDRYNTAIEEIIETNGIRQEREFPSNELLKHILLQVYNAAVTDPEKLNQYEPFSPEVYGETSYDLISSMIKKLELTEHDTFIDLGSGVGQVVLQVAASTPVRICYGIEKADVPAAYAEDMDSEFKFWMSWYGKTHRPYKLVKGDFLSTEKSISDKVNQSSIIFVNNFAFGPTLDHQLKLIFAELKDGTRIVSSKAYSSMNFRTTERNLNDIGAIMYSQLLFKKPIKEGVSWTNKGVEYFLQLIDRAKLQRHFEENNGKAKNGNGNGKGRDQEPNSTSSRGRTSRAPARRNVRTPASFYSEDSDESVIGPTTRRQWSDYVSRSNGKSSKENSEEDTQSSRSKTSSSSQSPKLNGSPDRKPKQRAENKMEEWKPTQSPGLSGQKRPRTQQENRSQRARATSPDIIYGNRSHAGLPRKGRRCMNEVALYEDDDSEAFYRRPTPPALRRYLEAIRVTMLNGIDLMSSPQYRQQIIDSIDLEQRKKNFLEIKLANLEESTSQLRLSSTVHLQSRLEELDIDFTSVPRVIPQVDAIFVQNDDLLSKVSRLQELNAQLAAEGQRLCKIRRKEIMGHWTEAGNNIKFHEDSEFMNSIMRTYYGPELSVLKSEEPLTFLKSIGMFRKEPDPVKTSEDESEISELELDRGGESSPEADLPLGASPNHVECDLLGDENSEGNSNRFPSPVSSDVSR